jgi:hypothetical protein
MFNSTLYESSQENIVLTDITSECFLFVLEFIYTDTIDISKIDLDAVCKNLVRRDYIGT